MKTYQLTGDINLQTSPALRTGLLNGLQNSGNLVVDLPRVTSIDSSGLAIPVEALAKTKRVGLSVRLANTNSACLKMIKLAHPEDVFGPPKTAGAHALH